MIVNVAATDDREHVPSEKPRAVFEDRGDAQRGRRFHDKTGVDEKQSHRGDDRSFPHQHRVIGDLEEVGQDGRNGTATRHTIRDGVG